MKYIIIYILHELFTFFFDFSTHLFKRYLPTTFSMLTSLSPTQRSNNCAHYATCFCSGLNLQLTCQGCPAT